MTFLEANPGDIVYSKAGRDKSSCFVIISVEDNYARICDGRRRKADNPKLKKLKHLKLGAGHSDYIAGKLANAEKVTNSELRREIDEFVQTLSEQNISEREC